TRCLSDWSSDVCSSDLVTVITCKPLGMPLHRADLAGGTSELVVIPDESRSDAPAESWERFGQHVDFVRLQLPRADFPYHYRCVRSEERRVGKECRSVWA